MLKLEAEKLVHSSVRSSGGGDTRALRHKPRFAGKDDVALTVNFIRCGNDYRRLDSTVERSKRYPPNWS